MGESLVRSRPESADDFKHPEGSRLSSSHQLPWDRGETARMGALPADGGRSHDALKGLRSIALHGRCEVYRLFPSKKLMALSAAREDDNPAAGVWSEGRYTLLSGLSHCRSSLCAEG
jgi:hypothetical protein